MFSHFFQAFSQQIKAHHGFTQEFGEASPRLKARSKRMRVNPRSGIPNSLTNGPLLRSSDPSKKNATVLETVQFLVFEKFHMKNMVPLFWKLA